MKQIIVVTRGLQMTAATIAKIGTEQGELMRSLAFYGSILFIFGLSLTACGNAGKDVQGTWDMSVMGIDAGKMIFTPDSTTIYPSVGASMLGSKQGSSKVKWQRSGNQITAIDEAGQKMTLTVVDQDHLNFKTADGDALLTREK